MANSNTVHARRQRRSGQEGDKNEWKTIQFEPSPEYTAAVEALKRLSLQKRLDAFAESAADELGAIADEKVGKPLAGRRSWKRLLGKRGEADDQMPGGDHVELREGDVITYTSHPYQLDLATLREMVRRCDENGLEVRIDTMSWYFPGQTLRVTYRPNPGSN